MSVGAFDDILIKKNGSINSATLELDMKDAKFAETTSLVLLLTVILLSPVIIFLVKSATSTIQVSSDFETAYRKLCYGESFAKFKFYC